MGIRHPGYIATEIVSREIVIGSSAIVSVKLADSKETFEIHLIHGSLAHPGTAPIYITYDGSDPVVPTGDDPSVQDFLDPGDIATVPAGVRELRMISSADDQYLRYRILI